MYTLAHVVSGRSATLPLNTDIRDEYYVFKTRRVLDRGSIERWHRSEYCMPFKLITVALLSVICDDFVIEENHLRIL